MYAVKPSGACRLYLEQNPLEEDEVLYDELPQFALDFAQKQLTGE